MSTPAVPSTEPAGHAGLMDEVYRYQRYLYDFTRKYYLFGRDSLIGDLKLGTGESLLEVGCGTGRNLIAIARANPGARLFGLDASAAMLETAAGQIRRAGLSGRITLVHGLAEQLTPAMFREAQFDNVMFSYSLSMIPDWRGALDAARASLAPGGRLHIVDFGDLTGLPGPARRLLEAWLARFHVAPRKALLHEIETSLRQNDKLRLLPGRYAFIFSG